jgi:hypothetical protein
MVHLPQDIVVEIAQVPGHQQADDLPFAVGEGLVAARPTLEDEVDMDRNLAFAEEVAPCLDRADVSG